jgi:hypothetical protein
VRRASTALGLALAAAAILPTTASAHAGRTAPAATAYIARISSAPAGVEARVVDGDQRLWLRVAPSRTAVVLGFRGERYLRFSSAGVAVNTRSRAYYLNRARPLTPPAGVGPGTPPVWKRISSGRSASWHEDRLHSLALAAHPSGDAFVGRWVVPLLVDGRRAEVRGGLWHAAPPSLLWLWPLALVLACVPALLRLRDARLETPVGAVLALLALAAATTARLGRELHGRPTLSAEQLALSALTCVVALALAALYLRTDWRALAGAAIGVVSVYQGVALFATLRNGIVLSAVPAWTERAAAVISLAAGSALIVAVLAGGIPRATEEQSRKGEPLPRY